MGEKGASGGGGTQAHESSHVLDSEERKAPNTNELVNDFKMMSMQSSA